MDVSRKQRPIPHRLTFILSSHFEGPERPLRYIARRMNVDFFPIADDATKYEAESPRRLKGLRQDAIDAIDAVKPYKGGNDLLWRLHKLNNISKHRFIVMAGSELRSFDLGGFAFRHMIRNHPDPKIRADLATMDKSVFFRFIDPEFPLRAGHELFADAPDAEVDEKLQFRFQVAFREPGIIEGELLIETVQSMAAAVDNLIVSFAHLLV
jgi:hypothetical protein